MPPGEAGRPSASKPLSRFCPRIEIRVCEGRLSAFADIGALAVGCLMSAKADNHNRQPQNSFWGRNLAAGKFPNRPFGLSLALAALSGLLLAGALPGLDWGWLAWVGLVPFLCLFPFKSAKSAFGHGLVLGIFYLGVMAYWIIVFAGHIIGPALSTLGWVLVSLYQAFYLGVWAVGAQWFRQRPNSWAFRLGVPALWAIVEWWRQLGALGLSWGDLAYTQHLALPILQLTKLTGMWGLAFLIVLVNIALYDLWQTRRLGAFPKLTAALLLLTLGGGVWSISRENLKPTFVAAALQGNINQNTEQNPAYVERVMQTFTAQGRKAAAQGATLVVWPETAFPGFLRGDASGSNGLARLSAEAVQNHQTLLVGGVEHDWTVGKNANALFSISPSGELTGSYQKRQLVPFGEFVPGRSWLPFVEALHVTNFDMKPGADVQPLLDGGPDAGKIGATICFESSYPRFLREQVQRGANLLVISTDDTWFGRTAAARQHSAIAAIRAAEDDRYLVRSAATGVSQVIDPTGRVLTEAGLFQAAVVAAPVQSRTTLTPYVRWGDWFVIFCALLLVSVSVPLRSFRATCSRV